MSIARVLVGAAAVAAGVFLVAKAVAAKVADAEFDGMDTDGNDRVSRAEHDAATRRMFASMDANSDGRVTAAEMDAAHEKVTGRKPKRGEPRAKAKIAAIDESGDGVLTRSEHLKGGRKMFAKMDTNVDGSLTREELAAGRAKLMPKKKPARRRRRAPG